MMFAHAHRQRDERGAILPLTIVVFAATLTLASLVIDVGGDRVVRRDMQSVADVVALDVARSLDGRAAGSYPGFDANAPSAALFASEKAASVDRQGGLLSEPTSVTVRLAIADSQTGAFIRWAGSSEVPNAVRVYATGASAFRIFATTPQSSNLQRSALAVTGQPNVCISAGATLVDLAPGGALDMLLGRLIGIDRLSVISPNGVASLDARVPLANLAAQLGVGTVDELATTNVSASSFMQAAATVLSNNGDLAAADIFRSIATRLSGAPTLNVGSILSLNTGTQSAANLRLEAFALAQAVIEVSNRENFVTIAAPVSVPGLTSSVIQAKIIEAPKIACGRIGTRAKSAQIQLKVTSNVGGLVSSLASAKIDPLLLTVGEGWGEITDIQCTPGVTRLRVAADTAVGRFKLHLAIEVLGGLLGVLIKPVTVDVPSPMARPDGATIGHGGERAPLTFVFNSGSNELPASQTAGTAMGNLGLASFDPIRVMPAGDIEVSVLQTLLGSIDGHLNQLLNPILEALGIRLGTVEIRPTTRPDCTDPGLRD